MSMIINPPTIVTASLKGIKYFIEFEYNPDTNVFSWKAFYFYTPAGNLTDTEGKKYFSVHADGFQIIRESIYKEHHLIFTLSEGAAHLEVIDFEELPVMEFGQEGDHVGKIEVPADDNTSMICNYRIVQ